jgi:hypothetical protein
VISNLTSQLDPSPGNLENPLTKLIENQNLNKNYRTPTNRDAGLKVSKLFYEGLGTNLTNTVYPIT